MRVFFYINLRQLGTILMKRGIKRGESLQLVTKDSHTLSRTKGEQIWHCSSLSALLTPPPPRSTKVLTTAAVIDPTAVHAAHSSQSY